MKNENEKDNALLELDEYEILDHTVKSPEVIAFENNLNSLVIGQAEAVEGITDVYQIYKGGLSAPNRPIATMLFLGPTGTGKTKTVEASAQVIFGKPGAVIKIDCGEFQHSHEIAKLKGSPPGYLGHRETTPMLTQENLDRYQTASDKMTFLLFDEIEKASDNLWNLLLGILDKATLTLGDNRVVDFSSTIVVMTSNLGAREMEAMLKDKIGFRQTTNLDEKFVSAEAMNSIAIEAARKRFSPEYINRIDKVVVFKTLSESAIQAILDLELEVVRQRISEKSKAKFTLRFSAEAKQFIQSQGIDKRYNARPLKRAIERLVVLPMSRIVSSIVLTDDDVIECDLHPSKQSLVFKKLKPAISLLEQVIDAIVNAPAAART